MKQPYLILFDYLLVFLPLKFIPKNLPGRKLNLPDNFAHVRVRMAISAIVKFITETSQERKSIFGKMGCLYDKVWRLGQ